MLHLAVEFSTLTRRDNHLDSGRGLYCDFIGLTSDIYRPRTTCVTWGNVRHGCSTNDHPGRLFIFAPTGHHGVVRIALTVRYSSSVDISAYYRTMPFF